MFTNSLRYDIANLVGAAIGGDPTFWARSRADQLSSLVAWAPGVDAADLRAFLLLILLRRKVIAIGSPEHLELAGPVKCDWHKANPPLNLRQFNQPGYEPSWVEEYDSISWVARNLCYSDLFQDPIAGPANFPPAGTPARIRQAAIRKSLSTHVAAALFREKFGIGGLTDIYHPNAIGYDDPTMAALVDAALDEVAILRAEWFGEAIPADDRKRSLEVIDTEAKAAYRKQQDELKAAKRRKEQEEARAAYRVATGAAIDALVAANLFKDPTVAGLLAADFEQLKAALATFPAALQPFANMVTPPVAPMENAPAEKVAKAAAEATELGQTFVVQAILKKIDGDEAKQSWLRELANGDLQLRPQPLRSRVTLTRPQRAVRGHLIDLGTKYGLSEMADGIKAVFGVEVVLTTLNVDAVPASAPAAPEAAG